MLFLGFSEPPEASAHGFGPFLKFILYLGLKINSFGIWELTPKPEISDQYLSFGIGFEGKLIYI